MSQTELSTKIACHVATDWRGARFAMAHQSAAPGRFGTSHLDDLARNTCVFLPIDNIDDLLAIRDWLHDEETVAGRYEMLATYEFADLVCKFTGLVFIFQQQMDAVHFRLFWQAEALADSFDYAMAA